MRVLVYGLGRSGLAVSRLLRRQGHEVVFYDRQPAPEQVAELSGLGCQRLGHPDISKLDPHQVDVVIAAPGVPWDHPDLAALRARGLETIGEVEWVYRTVDADFIGVTATAGKTTVTAWLCEVLQGAGVAAKAGGNIDPALAEVAAPGLTLVTELSSFMLERCPRFKPRVAVILNLGADHLDRHGSLAAYHAAKRRLLDKLGPGEVFVYNADDATLRAWARACPARKLAYSLEGDADAFLSGDALHLFGERLLGVNDLRVTGRHNLANALAVALAASAAGLETDEIRRGLRAFSGVPGRYSLVGKLDGVAFVEDSIATRSLAVAAALHATPAPIVWIGGGIDKGADLAVLESLVRDKVVLFIGIGEAGPKFAAGVGAWTQTLVCPEPSGRQALVSACRQGVRFLKARGRGGTVLLSPLAASFDQFKDYRERARAFREVVKSLGVPAWT